MSPEVAKHGPAFSFREAENEFGDIFMAGPHWQKPRYGAKTNKIQLFRISLFIIDYIYYVKLEIFLQASKFLTKNALNLPLIQLL